MQHKTLKILSILLVFSILFPISALGDPTLPPEIIVIDSDIVVTGSSAQTRIDLDAALRAADGRVGLIVELASPPLGLTPFARGLDYDLESPAADAYLMNLSQQQDQVVSQMQKLAPSALVGKRYGAAFNGFSILVEREEAMNLLELGAVKHIYPDRMRGILLDSSTEVINAPAFWDDLGGASKAGNGVRIAIIDTGIQPENPLFDGTDFVGPPSFPRGYCAEVPDDPAFQCNDKLIAARYYTPTFEIHPDETLSPVDFHGHGSHVAGIAAGNPVDVPAGELVPETTAISGVAPRAYVLAYKAIFTQPDGNAAGSDSMFLAAMNDAMLDGADVISNSWGGNDGGDPAESPYQNAIKALNEAGIVVVFAAGNAGPDAGTISCPGCLAEVITVGASTADRIFANTLDAISPETIPENLTGLAALVGDDLTITDPIEAQMIYSGDAAPGNTEGCSTFSGGLFTNSIALIPRGTCDFSVKVNHARDAGAVAVAIFNDEPGFPIPMGGLAGSSIPAVFLSQDQGEALRDWVVATIDPMVRINAQVTAVRNANWQDTLWGSSAVGPNGDPDILKPDIVAPGVKILSGAADGEGIQFLQGTSMAAPHVAGAAALLIQKHSDWRPEQIKTALTSTAAKQVMQPDGVSPATIYQMGAGRLDLKQALNAGVTFSQPSFANGLCSTACLWQAEIKNESLQREAKWEAQVSAPAGMKVRVEPGSVILGLGESRTFTVTADVSDVSTDQWHFVEIVWQPENPDYSNANLPLAAYVVEPDQAQLEKVVEKPQAFPGDTSQYTITLINDAPLTTTFRLQDPIPENATYVNGSATGGLIYDSTQNLLTTTIELDSAKMNIVTDTLYGYLSLPDLDENVKPIACPDDDCDEAAIVFSGFDFYFYGQHITDLVLSSNGFIQVGSEIPGSHWPNQELPDPAPPNSLIAPLWADFDLDGGDGIGSGAMYFALTQDPNTKDVYYVFEWKDAGLKNNPTAQYSFQVWIKLGTSEIWLVYGPQSSAVGTATVGVENPYGSAGYSYFYNGDGMAPSDGTSLKAITEVDRAIFTYALENQAIISEDLKNVVEVTNGRTGRIYQDSANVQIGDRIYLPLTARK